MVAVPVFPSLDSQANTKTSLSEPTIFPEHETPCRLLLVLPPPPFGKSLQSTKSFPRR